MHNLATSLRYILDNYAKAIPVEQKGAFVALCVARAVSVDLPLPTSPVTSIQVFYGSTCFNRAAEIVAAVNEVFIIDVKMTMDYVFKHYKLRYALVYDTQAIIPMLCGRDLTDELVPGNLQQVLRDNGTYSEMIEALRMAIRNVTDEIKDGDTVSASPAPTAAVNA